jgi:dihydrofolate synthase / folylpolyglutamate synthase
VLEVGMGGRLDATNVVDPLVSVITDISLDHQKFLGNTVGEIAREKSGIIRPGGVTVTLPQQREANDAIGEAILNLDAVAISAAQYVPPVAPASADYRMRSSRQAIAPGYRYPLEVMGRQILIESPLLGRHQLRNLALAIASAEQVSQKGFPGITPESIARGIRETNWPGRFQVRPPGNGWPETVFDVAHNPAGAWALRSALSEQYEDRPLIFMFGAMHDKAIREMTEILFPLAERVIATRPDNPRSASPEEILEAARRTGVAIQTVADTKTSLEQARTQAAADTILVVTGSIYLVGEAMRVLEMRVRKEMGPVLPLK